jgi:hypothetical protein
MPTINPFTGELEPTCDEVIYRAVPTHRDYGSLELNEKVRAARDELPREIGDHCYDTLIEEYGEDDVA